MWYNVKKQLPKFNELVLVWSVGYAHKLARYSFDNKWYNQQMDSAVVNVTHWQYLPSAPKKENTYD